MAVKFENNARTTIADVTLAAGATTVNVATGDGALFPTLSGGDIFYATMVDTSGNREIVKVTARSSDAMTIVRGEEGTTPRAFAQDDKFELRLTAGQLDLMCQRPASADTDNIATFDANDDVQDSGLSLADEDDMSSDSATKIPSQQSVKAYRDNPQPGDESRYAASSAGTDTYAITLSPVPTAYYTGMVVHFKADIFNTGACTLNVNTLGAKAIKKPNGADPATGDIRTNQFVPVIYDGTNFMLMFDPGAAVGSITAHADDTVPDGCLECDGSAVSRTTYAPLYAVLGDVYGNGDGSTTFNLPDYRGQFLRGWDHGAGTDPDAASRTDSGDGSTTGDNVGTQQADEIKSHAHSVGAGNSDGSGSRADTANNNTGSFNSGSTGGNETRPTNINVMYCVKY